MGIVPCEMGKRLMRCGVHCVNNAIGKLCYTASDFDAMEAEVGANGASWSVWNAIGMGKHLAFNQSSKPF